MKFQLLENQTANVTTEFITPGGGDYQLALYGTLDGATVKLVFSSDGTVALPDMTDFTWTALPESFLFEIKDGISVAAVVSNDGAATDISLAIHRNDR